MNKYLNGIPRLIFLLTITCLMPATSVAQPASATSKVAKTDWSAIRGVNYVPSYGKNLHEIWRHFDRDAFDRELALARKVGYNSVRLWLNYFAYQERGQRMIDDVETAVRLCRKHNLKAVIVLFDGCGARPRPQSRTMTVSEAYGFFLGSPTLSEKLKEIVRFNYKPFATGVGRDVLIQVGQESTPHVLLWQNWQPSPGYDMMGKTSWPQLDRYVRAVVKRLAGNNTVLAWDIMNEPEFASEEPFTQGMDHPDVRARVSGFLGHVREVIKKNHPNEIVTVGFASLVNCKEYRALADVLTFHVYGEPEVLEKAIKEARDFSSASGKPIFITETLANFAFMPYDVEALATDDGQLKHYQKVLPTLIKSPIGWMGWGLIVGRIFNPYCDIFYANGHPRPAALYLEKTLKQQ